MTVRTHHHQGRVCLGTVLQSSLSSCFLSKRSDQKRVKDVDVYQVTIVCVVTSISSRAHGRINAHRTGIMYYMITGVFCEQNLLKHAALPVSLVDGSCC
jgi:hypothetical protein